MIAVIAFSHFGCVLLGGASAMLFRELIMEKGENDMMTLINELKRENRELAARVKWQYDVKELREAHAEAAEVTEAAEAAKLQVIDPNYINAIEERNKYLIERNDMLAEQVSYLKRNGESAHQNMFRAYIVAVIVGLMALITTTAMYNYTSFILRRA
jgi:hypothetical protein